MSPVPKLRARARTRFAKAKPRLKRGSIKLRKGNLCPSATAKGGPIRGKSLGKIRETAAAGHKAGRRTSISRGPGKHWERKPAVIVLSGERERCNPGTPEGRAEYEWRRVLMFIRQYCQDVDAVLCCVCRMPLKLTEATWEHEFGRHASRIDERLWHPEKKRHQNGVSHLWCNSQRGSRRTEIHHGNNCVIDKEKTHA